MRALVSQLCVFDAAGWAEHDYHDVFLKSQAAIEALLDKPLSEASLLVLGCGYNYPDVLLYAPRVSEAVGVDVLGAFYRDGLIATWRDAASRERRWLLALLDAVAKRGHYARYFRHLKRLSGRPLDHAHAKLASYDGLHLPFPDAHFDIVLSNAVLEHVEDCPAVAAELARVTRPGGLSYHLWHNYYSYSGGHMPDYVCRQAPWGHLRGLYQKRGLNRLTPEAMAAAFAPHFAVSPPVGRDAHHRPATDPGYQADHQELLTPALQAELAAYSRELLLTRAYLLIGSKR